MTEQTATPAAPATSLPRLLIVVEDSPLGLHTARMGVSLAASLGTGVVFHATLAPARAEVHTTIQLEQALHAREELCREHAKRLFAAANQIAAQAGLRSENVLVIGQPNADAISRLAQEKVCSIIVIGSRGRGAVARMIKGSLVDELIRHARCPVLVCREEMGFGVVAPMPAAPPP